jgi:hypothetical protein
MPFARRMRARSLRGATLVLCVVAMVVPPAAAVLGNRREPGERWWDEDGSGSGDADGKE